MTSRESRGPLPLSEPVFQILLSLADRSLHGYAIILDVRERTDGDVDLTASTLYAALKRMLRDGWLEEAREDDAAADPRRRTYVITRLGREILTREARRLERAARMAREKAVLGPEPARGEES